MKLVMNLLNMLFDKVKGMSYVLHLGVEHRVCTQAFGPHIIRVKH